MKKIVVFYLSLVLVLITSCTEDGANSKISISTPSPDFKILVGNNLNTIASLDQGNMNQYKVELKLISPCEDIDSAGGVNFINTNYVFVSGANYNEPNFSHAISLDPQFLPGYYYLIASAIVNSSSSISDTVNVYIQNAIDTIKPVSTFSMPSASTTINREDTIKIRGEITELLTNSSPGNMKRIKITMIANFSGQPTLNLYSFAGNPINDSIKVNYKIPASIMTGNYTMEVSLLDEFNNFKTYTFSVSVN